jgi:hypothetical protein
MFVMVGFALLWKTRGFLILSLAMIDLGKYNIV